MVIMVTLEVVIMTYPTLSSDIFYILFVSSIVSPHGDNGDVRSGGVDLSNS